jgi:hypothetical protein
MHARVQVEVALKNVSGLSESLVTNLFVRTAVTLDRCVPILHATWRQAYEYEQSLLPPPPPPAPPVLSPLEQLQRSRSPTPLARALAQLGVKDTTAAAASAAAAAIAAEDMNASSSSASPTKGWLSASASTSSLKPPSPSAAAAYHHHMQQQQMRAVTFNDVSAFVASQALQTQSAAAAAELGGTF